jgi:hypothetical protein
MHPFDEARAAQEKARARTMQDMKPGDQVFQDTGDRLRGLTVKRVTSKYIVAGRYCWSRDGRTIRVRRGAPCDLGTGELLPASPETLARLAAQQADDRRKADEQRQWTAARAMEKTAIDLDAIRRIKETTDLAACLSIFDTAAFKRQDY